MEEEGILVNYEEREFYEAVGRAITNWANLEDVLFSITHEILNCTEEQAAIVFYQHNTLTGRLTLTHNLVRSHFPEKEDDAQPDIRLTQWSDLYAKVRNLISFRNDLAHHSVGPILAVDENNEFKITPASHKTYAAQLTKKDMSAHIHCIADVREHMLVVSNLVQDFRNFLWRNINKP
jgi:hypothetical protein